MQYSIYLKRKDGTYKVSGFESRSIEASRQLALYLFRHYPVRFYDDKVSEEGETEKILKDSRSGLVIWRQGDMECKLPEGFFFVNENKMELNSEEKWWQIAFPESKKQVIELDIENAYKDGFQEGYMKGLEQGKDEGYRQGIHDYSPILN